MPDETKKPTDGDWEYMPLSNLKLQLKQAQINELEKKLKERDEAVRHLEASRDYWKTNYYTLHERVRQSLSGAPVRDEAPPQTPPKAAPKPEPRHEPVPQRPTYPEVYHLSGPGDLEAGRILEGRAAKERAEGDRRAMERDWEEWRRTNRHCLYRLIVNDTRLRRTGE